MLDLELVLNGLVGLLSLIGLITVGTFTFIGITKLHDEN
jgi:hypothetical protein